MHAASKKSSKISEQIIFCFYKDPLYHGFISVFINVILHDILKEQVSNEKDRNSPKRGPRKKETRK